ncbi:MAG: pyridoxal-phosphate dependent enzyme, partial [Pseudomonadota bacterium]
GLKTEIVPVVSARADAYARSFEAGRVISAEGGTFADGVDCRVPWEQPLEILRRGAERIVRVSDDEIAEAMRVYHMDTHNMAEAAGAVPLAALMQERARMQGRRVGVILCGGNVDRSVYAEVLAGRTPKV